MNSTDSIIAISGMLLLLGALSNKVSSRFNLPILLLFLAAGVFAESILPFSGSDYASQINFFGIIAMCFILFAGGSDTSPDEIRPVALRGVLLAVLGVIITALITGAGAYFLLKMQHSFIWCLLLGSLISSTDAAAVFAILRGRGIGLSGTLKPLLELESGSNDPTAAFMTIAMIGCVTGSNTSGIMLAIPQIIYQLGGGILAGFLFGKATKWIFRVELEHNGLYFVASFSMILLCYSITQLLGANGFMACYVCGIILNSGRYNYQKTLNKFHNGVAWLMQVGLFTVLGFLASPKDLFNISVWLPGIILGFLLIFVARPLAVFICLFKSGYNIREKLMISWVGIRGAAPIVLATFPLAAGVEDAQLMFRLIFFMVILSVTLQGWLLMPAAKWLKVARTVEAQPEPAPLELEVTESTSHQEMREFQITANNPMNGKNLAEIALPTGVLITMVRRDKKLFPPRGDTVLKAGDSVLIMAEIPLLAEVESKYFKTASTK